MKTNKQKNPTGNHKGNEKSQPCNPTLDSNSSKLSYTLSYFLTKSGNTEDKLIVTFMYSNTILKSCKKQNKTKIVILPTPKNYNDIF